MKKIFFLAIFLTYLCSNLSLKAQRVYLPEEMEKEPCPFEEKIVLDSAAQLECIYAFTEVDSVLENACNHELMVQIGNKAILQTDLNKYLCDSVFRKRDYNMTLGEALDVHAQHYATYWKEFYRSGGLCHERQNIAMEIMEYADSGAIFNWRLAEDTLTVCGYLCHKATAHFRGRTWTAWYTEQIPLDAGPWKFNGLPGLILKATDNNAYHDFEAIAVRQPHTSVITYDIRENCIKVKRERFREQEEYAALHLASIMLGKDLVQDSSLKDSRMFYSPLELE